MYVNKYNFPFKFTRKRITLSLQETEEKKNHWRVENSLKRILMNSLNTQYENEKNSFDPKNDEKNA
jgi:hypothetical protein